MMPKAISRNVRLPVDIINTIIGQLKGDPLTWHDTKFSPSSRSDL